MIIYKSYNYLNFGLFCSIEIFLYICRALNFAREFAVVRAALRGTARGKYFSGLSPGVSVSTKRAPPAAQRRLALVPSLVAVSGLSLALSLFRQQKQEYAAGEGRGEPGRPQGRLQGVRARLPAGLQDVPPHALLAPSKAAQVQCTKGEKRTKRRAQCLPYF